ncbi:MAG: hypothetical protein RBS48_11065 [Ignavibacteriaceae bacterium]|jgi:hypothetical protein|nr:hypothetical protein [Ignavibacteriaceae bacterium]
MNIDVFENYNFNYPEDTIICMNNYNEEDINRLIEFFKHLIFDTNFITYNLTDQEFVDSKVNLLFKIDNEDIGIEKVNNNYICGLTTKTYNNIIHKLLNHKKHSFQKGHLWLYDTLSSYELLLSYDKQW